MLLTKKKIEKPSGVSHACQAVMAVALIAALHRFEINGLASKEESLIPFDPTVSGSEDVHDVTGHRVRLTPFIQYVIFFHNILLFQLRSEVTIFTCIALLLYSIIVCTSAASLTAVPFFVFLFTVCNCVQSQASAIYLKSNPKKSTTVVAETDRQWSTNRGDYLSEPYWVSAKRDL